MTPTRFYSFRGPKGLPGGDYGDVLQSGIILGSKLIRYARTGPYAPGIAFPGGAIVVKKEISKTLSASQLSGFSFAALSLEKAVLLDWKPWNSKTWIYPSDLFKDADNEPEDYILYGPHSAELATSMGGFLRLELTCDSKPGKHGFFCHPRDSQNYVSEAGKAWLEQHCPGEVSFSEEAF